MKYYHITNGHIIGPNKLEHIIGSINSQTWIRKEGEDWVKAQDVGEISDMIVQSEESIDHDRVFATLNMNKIEDLNHQIFEDLYPTGAILLLILVLFIAQWWVGVLAVVFSFSTVLCLFFYIIASPFTSLRDLYHSLNDSTGCDDLSLAKRYLMGDFDRFKCIKVRIRILSYIAMVVSLFVFNPDQDGLLDKLWAEQVEIESVITLDIGFYSLFGVMEKGFQHPVKPERLYLGINNIYLKIFDVTWVSEGFYFKSDGYSINHNLTVESKALLVASAKGDIQSVKQLLEKGAYINAVNDHNESPLVLATAHNHKDLVKFLLDQGAVIVTKSEDGITLYNDDLDLFKDLFNKLR